MKNDEHTISMDELYKRLNSTAKGLSTEEAEKRQRQFGLNELEEREKKSVIVRFGKHLVNFFALLLWTGSILAFVSEYLAPGEGNLYIGIALAEAGFFSYFVVLYRGGWTWGQQLAMSDPLYQKAVTAFFASIVICQVADVMICRTRQESVFTKGLLANKLILAGIVFELFLLGIIVFNPFTHKFYGTHPLTFFELSLSVPFALWIFFGDEVRKFFIRKNVMLVKNNFSW